LPKRKKGSEEALDGGWGKAKGENENVVVCPHTPMEATKNQWLNIYRSKVCLPFASRRTRISSASDETHDFFINDQN
jgi:hypothetical protein